MIEVITSRDLLNRVVCKDDWTWGSEFYRICFERMPLICHIVQAAVGQ